MEDITVYNKYQYFFRSDAATQDDPNNYAHFSTILKKILTLKNRERQFVLTINRVHIPYCFNQFDASDSSSLVTFTLAAGGPVFYSGSVVFPNGNYTITEMATQLVTLVPANIITNVPAIATCTMNWTYSSIKNRLQLQLLGSLYLGLPWSITFNVTPIIKAMGYWLPLSLFVNSTFVEGDHSVNVNPLMNIYVTSNLLTDSDAFQCFQGVTDSNIVAVVPLNHTPRYYIDHEYNVPVRIVIDNDVINIIDFDLRDYYGNVLKGFDQPWMIQFTISEERVPDAGPEMATDIIQTVPLSNYQLLDVHSIPQSIENTINDTNQNLETLKSKLEESLKKLQSNVQKRKNTPIAQSTIPENSTSSASAISELSSIAPTFTGETKQTSSDSRAAKRQREAEEISENINS